MKNFMKTVASSLECRNIQVFGRSYAETVGLEAVYVRVDGEDYAAVHGSNAGKFQAAFQGEGEIMFCPMNHENRLVLNSLFYYTVPRAFGRDISTFSFGDRLGIAAGGHLSACENARIKPVLAQQSIRELTLSGRSYEDVLDAAAWGVFKYGYKGGYGADGDHLKNLEEVKNALALGASMITLDCSLVLKELPESAMVADLAYAAIPDDERSYLEKEYMNNAGLKEFGLGFDRKTTVNIVLVYSEAVKLAVQVDREIQRCGRAVDLEISLDETMFTTSPEAHWFVANELERHGVRINSMAPRFVGEFQKAVDYIGDLDELRVNLRAHARIADYFGYKLSIHSASDKFSAYPVIAEETKGRFHVKTSGTSWLEAVRVIAVTEPALYRDIHRKAIAVFPEASQFYEVHGDPSDMKPLESVADTELIHYLEEDGSRQVLHIAYGFVMQDPELKSRVYEALKVHENTYQAYLEKHFKKHLHLLNVL